MSEGIGTLRELRAALDARETSSVEIVGRCLRRAEASQETLRAFVGLRAEAALREAEESDARRGRGDARSPIEPIFWLGNLLRFGSWQNPVALILAAIGLLTVRRAPRQSR